MADCPKQYKNHGEEAFGEGKYVTAEMLKQFCKNDSFLKGETEDLWLEINPTSRKRLNPLPVDENVSYGVTIPNDTDKISRLSNSTSETIFIDFSDDTLIDNNASTAAIESLILTGETKKRATLPRKVTETLHKTTRNYSPWAIPDGSGGFEDFSDLTCNEHWYVSFDKNRNYETRPNWLNNHFNGEIPGVCRAQTFKAKNSGKLEAITLNLKGGFNTGVPLTVGIFDTVEQDGVLYPKSTHDFSHGQIWLARQDVEFDVVDPGIYTVKFENPCTVEQGKTYAFALFSNLTHPSTPYLLGGWSQSCQAHIYEDGDAFLSENSGATWTRYGKTEEEVPYHYGQQAPQDFAFICHIRQYDGTKYPTNTPHYVYLKPIRCNPCTQISLINPVISGTSADCTIEFQVSTDGVQWEAFDNTGIISFTDNPTMIFCRVMMKTTNELSAPIVESFNLQLTTEAATEGYARLAYYYPPTDGMLGANVWGSIYTPYVLEADQSITDCEIELISNRTVNEHFEILAPLSIQNYAYLPELEDYADAIAALSTEEEAEQYLSDTPEVVAIFAARKMYIIGFITSIALEGKPAYPMVDANLTTKVDDEDVVIQFGEWYDYDIDYDANTLTFQDSVTLTAGTLNVQYNPVIVKGLKQEDLPFRMDYIKEKFTFSANDLINGEFKLKACPNDPITKVVCKEKELEEDIDFSIDYVKGILKINNLNDQGTSLYQIGDVIEITYTPAITDTGISIGYNLTRKNVSYNVNLGIDNKGKGSYIEYKS